MTQSYAYPATSNRLSAITQGSTTLRSFLYDAAGNTSQDTRGTATTVYAYDHAGRLRTVTVGGSPKGTYTYDGMDRLAIRAVTNSTPSGTTHFLYVAGGGGAFEALMPGVGAMTSGLGNRVIAETNGAGVSLREYVWLGDQVLAVVDNANTANPTPYWVTNDHLGRPVQMTDANRAVVWRAKYRPFGEVSAVTGSASLDTRFPGQWFQLESGLSFNWHRHYDPTLGRYSQPDPLGISAGPSVYGYANLNPQTWIDPEGLFIPGLGGLWGWLSPQGPKYCQAPANPKLDEPLLSAPLPPPPTDIPNVDWNDPSNPPIGADGKEWAWRGQPPQGGDKGGYVNPSNPKQSVHPDMNHGPPGPHYDFTDRDHTPTAWRTLS